MAFGIVESASSVRTEPGDPRRRRHVDHAPPEAVTVAELELAVVPVSLEVATATAHLEGSTARVSR